MKSLHLLLILPLFSFIGCKPDEPTMNKPVIYAGCKMNQIQWDAHPTVLEVKNGDIINIGLFELYNDGKVTRSLSLYAPLSLGKHMLHSTDSFHGQPAFNAMTILDYDFLRTKWKLNDSLEQSNFVIIDSISPNGKYVKGRFSAELLTCCYEGNINLNDPKLSNQISITEGWFAKYLSQ